MFQAIQRPRLKKRVGGQEELGQSVRHGTCLATELPVRIPYSPLASQLLLPEPMAKSVGTWLRVTGKPLHVPLSSVLAGSAVRRQRHAWKVTGEQQFLVWPWVMSGDLQW